MVWVTEVEVAAASGPATTSVRSRRSAAERAGPLARPPARPAARPDGRLERRPGLVERPARSRRSSGAEPAEGRLEPGQRRALAQQLAVEAQLVEARRGRSAASPAMRADLGAHRLDLQPRPTVPMTDRRRGAGGGPRSRARRRPSPTLSDSLRPAMGMVSTPSSTSSSPAGQPVGLVAEDQGDAGRSRSASS